MPAAKNDACRLILTIGMSFPCLTRFRILEEDGGFDADAFHKRLRGCSKGEYLCAVFLLNVWNPGYAKSKKWRFDVFEFLDSADSGNREAFLKWAYRPIWP